MNGAGDEDKPGNKSPDESVTGSNQRHLTIVDNRLDSRDLFTGTRDIVILHGRDTYHLRLTALNKLILTK
jgi:hemin uptake protein HemP